MRGYVVQSGIRGIERVHHETCSERIREVGALAVNKIIEVRRPGRASRVLTANADECSGKVRASRNRGLVGKDARIQMTGHPRPLAVTQCEGKVETFEIDLYAQTHGLAGRNRD